ncbi:MAG: hypothetical protein CME19_00805 [Gemmatimonadetes bacterium]|nr:hypothetical protein [Gemmatimonadota bacterium]
MILNDTAGTLQPEMIPVSIRQTNSLATLKWNSEQLIINFPGEGVTFEEVRRRLIKHTLKSTDCSKNRSARMLKISRAEAAPKNREVRPRAQLTRRTSEQKPES